jgi:hypothetical protein
MKKVKNVKKNFKKLGNLLTKKKENEERYKYIDHIGSEKDQKEIEEWNRMFDER